MADSFGSGFPRVNINPGHTFFDVDILQLFVYKGGDTLNPVNWESLNAAAVVGGGGVQRWPWKVTGTEWGAAIAADAEHDFIAPNNGTITKWGIVIYVGGSNQDILVQLVRDKFNTFDLIDQFNIVTLTTQTVVERVVAEPVVLGSLVSIFFPNILNPADLGVKISGYVDFTPS